MAQAGICPAPSALNPPRRLRIIVNGIVQGVGFRPFVYRLALRHRLTGLVANSSHGVIIEAQGDTNDLQSFHTALRQQAPAPAFLADITLSDLPPRHDEDFTILQSDSSGQVSTLIAPDLSICDDCRRELFDQGDRRYRYPFINCTHCGPRFTIIKSIPYDRPTTAMARFVMCPACQAEYDAPDNRRFHAQPNACPACGPQATLCDSQGRRMAGDVFSNSAALLASGKIVAIKGLGGFHLAVDAANDQAVLRLRARKGRAEKPFAIMAPDLAVARTLGALSPAAERLLTSPQRPILLAKKKEGALISAAVAPGVGDFGLLLPYTPLHYLLMDSCQRRPLVMTSANLSEEPICIDNHEAMSRLAGIADAFLLHDRDIVCRADDSVFMLRQGDGLTPEPRPAAEKTKHTDLGAFPLRRSRGQAPMPILVRDTGPEVLAVGGELKNVICLLKERYAFPSQHLGDLKNLAALGFFREAIGHFLAIFQGNPQLVVHDLHPGYLSSLWAIQDSPLPTLAVQHHHAHLAACLAENQHPGPAIGVILDGTGYGTDGTIWGGEILIGGLASFRRYAFLEPMPLPGGEAAIREPWRAAVGYLAQVYGQELPALDFLTRHDWQPVAEIARRGIQSPMTSSGGRLFDAVAAMAGGRQEAGYEGQAAIEFMYAGARVGERAYAVEIKEGKGGKMMMISPLLRQLVTDIQAGTPFSVLSQTFHRTLIELLAASVRQAAHDSGLDTVALSGGVMANSLLLNGLTEALSKDGFTVLSHHLLPPGDGCLSLGQAVIGRCHLLSKSPASRSAA